MVSVFTLGSNNVGGTSYGTLIPTTPSGALLRKRSSDKENSTHNSPTEKSFPNISNALQKKDERGKNETRRFDGLENQEKLPCEFDKFARK